MTPHRRQFMKGQWIEETAARAPTRNAEIAQHDPCGKLVVLLDSAQGAAIGESLTRLSLMPHVLSATLVFHGMDAD